VTVRDVLDACREEAAHAARLARSARRARADAEWHGPETALGRVRAYDARLSDSLAERARESAARFARALPRTWRRLILTREGGA
jgi:hypothetical protein